MFNKFKPSIFSIHLGIYQSKNAQHFHAHIYIPIANYLDLSLKYDFKINVNVNKWQSILTKEGEKYKNMDLDRLHKMSIHHKTIHKQLPELPYNYKIIFHPSQPRIAFVKGDLNINVNRRELIDESMAAMMHFTQYYQLNNRTKGGCHIVLQNGLYPDILFKNILGYIQVDIINYYHINPNRETWIKNFLQEPYLVIT
jgi:hypothetical protein